MDHITYQVSAVEQAKYSRFIKSFQLHDEKGQCNILLFGPKGVGKSSFINTVESALRSSLKKLAEVKASPEHVTSTLESWSLPSNPNIRIWDCMGWDEKNWEDGKISSILDGHVPPNGSVTLWQSLASQNSKLIQAPKESDRVHAVVIVLTEATVTSEETLSQTVAKWVRESEIRKLPTFFLLTKIDEMIGTTISDDGSSITLLFFNAIRQRIQEYCGEEVPVLPMINYSTQTKKVGVIDFLALLTMKQILERVVEATKNVAKENKKNEADLPIESYKKELELESDDLLVPVPQSEGLLKKFLTFAVGYISSSLNSQKQEISPDPINPPPVQITDPVDQPLHNNNANPQPMPQPQQNVAEIAPESQYERYRAIFKDDFEKLNIFDEFVEQGHSLDDAFLRTTMPFQ